MEKSNKIKLFIALLYVIAVSLFVYLLFSKFTIQEITSYDFIKNNRNYFFELKEANLFLLSFSFFIFCILWTLAAGFGSPIIIFSGFVFGKWLGTFLVLFGMTIGATGLYYIANFFLKDFIRQKFLSKFQILEKKFKQSEFAYLLLYRFIGGIPFALSNVLPCIFNVKSYNFFWATLIGMAPQIFIVASIASGFEKVIDNNFEAPNILDVIFEPGIYMPLIAFALLLIITFVIKKTFYKQ